MPERIGLEAELDMAAFNQGLRQYIDGIGRMEATTAKKGGAISKVLGGIGKVAAGVMAAGIAAGAAAIAGIAVVIKSTLPLASDFQAQLVGLQLAASQSGLSFDDLHDAALQVGGDTRLLGVSATGAADAMTGLFKAGLSVTEIFGDVNAYMEEGAELGGALRAAIDLAAATELDMVQASDLAAIALATFGGELESEEERARFVAAAMDNLVRAADASVAEVSDLAAALTMVGPGAVALGYSIEDVNNALAVLSTAGIAGTRAGTALDGMLRSLQAPGQEAADTMAALGIELYNVDGTFRQLPDIIGQFSKALTVGGTTTKKVSALTQKERKELAKLQKQYTTATKKLGEYHKRLRGTTQSEKARLNSMARLEEQINILNIDMGPLITRSEQYTTVTHRMTEAQRNQALGAIFTAQGQRAMNTLLAEGVEGWEAMAAATDAATGIQAQAEARAATFAGQMEALEGQIETLKIGIGEAFLPVAQNLMGAFSKLVEEHGPALTEAFGRIGAWLGEKLPAAIEVASQLWTGTLQPALAVVGDFIAEKAIPTFTDIYNWLKDKIPEAIGVASGFWTGTLKPALETVGNFIRDEVIPRIQAVSDWLGVKMSEAIKIASGFWTGTLKPALETVRDFIRDEVIPKIKTIYNWLKVKVPEAIKIASKFWEETLKPALKMVWDYLEENIFPAFKTVYDWLQEKIPEAVEVVREWWEETLFGALAKIWEFIRDEVIPKFKELAQLFEERFKQATEDTALLWEETLQPALKIVRDYVRDEVIPAFKGIAKLFEKELKFETVNTSNLWRDTLKPALTEVWEVVSEDIIPIFTALADLWKTVVGLELQVLTALWDKLFGKMSKDVNPILLEAARIFEERLSKQVEWLSGKLSDLWDVLRKVWKIISEKVVKAINSMTSALKKLQPPGWLTGHSLSPFELTLKGINRELAKLAAYSIPRVQAGLGSLGAPIAVTSEVMHRVSAPALFQRPAMTMPASSSRTVNVNMGGVSIYDQMSAGVFEARVRQIMASSVGG